jgi:hypothetical protein
MYAAVQSSAPGDKEAAAEYQAAMRFAARWQGLVGVGALQGSVRGGVGSSGISAAQAGGGKGKGSLEEVQLEKQNLTHEVPSIKRYFFVHTNWR